MLSFVFPEHNNWNLVDSANIWTEERIAIYFVEWLQKNQESLKFINYIILKKKIQIDNILLTSLANAFPHYKWGYSKSLSLSLKKSQYMLNNYLKHIFPTQGILNLF